MLFYLTLCRLIGVFHQNNRFLTLLSSEHQTLKNRKVNTAKGLIYWKPLLSFSIRKIEVLLESSSNILCHSASTLPHPLWLCVDFVFILDRQGHQYKGASWMYTFKEHWFDLFASFTLLRAIYFYGSWFRLILSSCTSKVQGDLFKEATIGIS